MKAILTIFFFLISFSAISQAEMKTHIGKSKEEIRRLMQNNTSYVLQADTVHILAGEVLFYKLINYNDSTILNNRILNFMFFFEKGNCISIRFVLYGSDALSQLIERIDSGYRRVGVNVWIDSNVNVGIRIIQLDTFNYQNANIDLFQIDIASLEVFKH
jgi:hypothetical protein